MIYASVCLFQLPELPLPPFPLSLHFSVFFSFFLKVSLSLSVAADVGVRHREPPRLHGETAGESNL